MVGIEKLAFHTPACFLELATLAERRGVDPGKYLYGIGQDQMGVLPPDEDVVTMGANAARHVLDGVDLASIDSLMLATESGIDQSKAAAIYVHQLLNLPSTCKAFEIKQACCGSTAALQMAVALVEQRPDRRVLIVASDVARYGLDTPGEPTQGAGAVALLISATPRVMVFDAESGSYTEDVMDFWRPNYLDEALVDGKYSIKVYLRALEMSWQQYQVESGRTYDECARVCFHLPFTRMADKAHRHLGKVTGSLDQGSERFEASLVYNRKMGNSYTASLYVGLASLLEQSPEDLTGQRVGLFSYGSGCMATFFSGVVMARYQEHLQPKRHEAMLASRVPLTYADYERFYNHVLPEDGSTYKTPVFTTGGVRLAGIGDHKRQYVTTCAPVVADATARPAVLEPQAV